MKNLTKKLILTIALPFLLNINAEAPVSEKRPICKFENGKYSIDKKLTDKKSLYVNIAKSFSEYMGGMLYVEQPKTFPEDYWQNPEETKKTLEGNCADKAILLNDTLEKILPGAYYLVYGKLKKENKVSHMWQEFIIGKDTFIVASSKKVSIYEKSKFRKLNKGDFYKAHSDSFHIDYLSRKVNRYEKRNNKRLNFNQLSKK